MKRTEEEHHGQLTFNLTTPTTDGWYKKSTKSIKITSFRKENVYGDHKVSFYNKENVRNFIHEALSRDIFAKGALKRAESLFQAKPGLYDLSSFK